MVKYLFLLYGRPEDELPGPGSAQFGRMLAQWSAATGAMAEAGVLIDCAPLQPPAAATTVAVRDGEMLLTDGPAAEIKEHFGGYTLVECADLDEALKWAAVAAVTRQVGDLEVAEDATWPAGCANSAELRQAAPALFTGPAAGLRSGRPSSPW